MPALFILTSASPRGQKKWQKSTEYPLRALVILPSSSAHWRSPGAVGRAQAAWHERLVRHSRVPCFCLQKHARMGETRCRRATCSTAATRATLNTSRNRFRRADCRGCCGRRRGRCPPRHPVSSPQHRRGDSLNWESCSDCRTASGCAPNPFALQLVSNQHVNRPTNQPDSAG